MHVYRHTYVHCYLFLFDCPCVILYYSWQNDIFFFFLHNYDQLAAVLFFLKKKKHLFLFQKERKQSVYLHIHTYIYVCILIYVMLALQGLQQKQQGRRGHFFEIWHQVQLQSANFVLLGLHHVDLLLVGHYATSRARQTFTMVGSPVESPKYWREKFRPLNEMLGNQTETQLWVLEMTPIGFKCDDKPIQARRNKNCTQQKQQQRPNKKYITILN